MQIQNKGSGVPCVFCWDSLRISCADRLGPCEAVWRTSRDLKQPSSLLSRAQPCFAEVFWLQGNEKDEIPADLSRPMG